MEYYSAIKRNTFESVPMRWMNLEPIIQSEVKSERKSVIYKCIYIESRKMGVMNLLAGQHWRHRHRERTCGHRRGRRGWDERREQRGNMHITVRERESQWELAV